jgi:hypothetical protein
VRSKAFTTAPKYLGGSARVATMALQNSMNWRRDTPRAFNASGNDLLNESIVHLAMVMAKLCSASA